ncbi:MAG TPA: FAD:protein FMN transferase [Bryobacteraceae bacterium]|nr:FAD:protein FMN transferase [Bryobacteraceae bacterium]
MSAALFLSGALLAQQPELLRLDKAGDAMGATYSVVLYGRGQAQMEAAADAALDEVSRLDAMLSNYRASSEWSEVNRHAAEAPVKVSPELFQLLSACVEYSRASEGAFDISVGPLMKLWGFYKGYGSLPKPAEVAAAIGKIGYRHIHLDAAASTVSFDRPGVELDPGGIGKGYAVDRMVDVLRRRGFQIALVAASDSSIYGMGAPPTEPRGWRVEIKDPRNARRAAAEVFLKDMSLSTSGSSEKFFRAEGRTYAHIMDPRTGYPAQGTLAVSIVSPRTIDSEAWAKPYFVNGRQWAAKHKPAEFRVFFCEDKAEQPCAWLP